MKREKLTDVIRFDITKSEMIELERMAEQGGFKTRHALCRSMIRAVLDDDRKCHQEQAA